MEIDIISLLSSDGYIMCNKYLAKLFGRDTAILLGELCAEYNYYKAREELTEDNSFYSTQTNIEENTTLTAYEQRKALKILQDANLITVSRRGIPSKNYYRINTEELCKLYSNKESISGSQSLKNLTSSNSDNSQMLKNLTSRGLKTKQLGAKDFNLNNNKNNNKKENNILYSNEYKTESSTTTSDYDSHMYSKDDFLGSGKKATKKKSEQKTSLYSKCCLEIDSYTQNVKLGNLLIDYLKLRLAMKDKPIYGVAQWKGLLNKLTKTIEDNPYMCAEDIVSQSIELGYASFYPLKNSKNYSKQAHNKVFSETESMSCERCTTTNEERAEILRSQGLQEAF